MLDNTAFLNLKYKFMATVIRGHNYGWEIDHINPVANGGTDIDNNLQPLNWKNNAAKSDKLNWLCGQ
jgi:5-methylcytosine-specific restriction endonuclease McrA